MSLICDICLEEYGDNDKSEKAPKMLMCGHTFCCKCIKETMKKNDNQIICSIDRLKDERKFEAIPFNRIVYDIILKGKEIENTIKEKEEEKKEKEIEQIIKENENEILNISNENIKEYDIALNIGLIGNQSGGKTSISKCYQDNKPLENYNYYQPTIGLDFFIKYLKIKDEVIYVKIWDTTGQERFNSITSGYLRGLHGCFIVFDLTDRKSFENLNKWIQFYNDFNHFKEKIMIILGNKVDKAKKRVVTYKEAKNFAKKKNLLYFETSAMNMHNINAAFEAMIKLILEVRKNYEKDEYEKTNKKLKKITRENKEEPKGGCCF